MGMSRETFLKRLENRKANNYLYKTIVVEGLVAIWKLGSDYILTWEECPPGECYNEHLYTRDERHKFATVDELAHFLDKNGLDFTCFEP